MKKKDVKHMHKEAAILALSDDYKERFQAEYLQLKLRAESLKKLLNRWEAYYNSNSDTELEKWLGFKPNCSKDLLERQLRCMYNYLEILEIRAEIEGIEL